MSARPRLETMADEDLDLLLSRSLDDDLAAEDAQELDAYLATHPEARARRDALARVVKGLQKLPVHAEPFALGTRVHAQVTEDASAFGSAWHRFGIYPPPGLAIAGAALLGLVVVATALFSGPKPQPAVASKQAPAAPATQVNEPVPIFFPEAESKKADRAEKAETQAKRQEPARSVGGEADDRLAGKDARPVEQLASADSNQMKELDKAKKNEGAKLEAGAGSGPVKTAADQAAPGSAVATGQLASTRERPADRKADSEVAYAPEPAGLAEARSAPAPAPPAAGVNAAPSGAAVARQAEEGRVQARDADEKGRREVSEMTAKKVGAAKPAMLAPATWRVDVTTPGWRVAKSSPSPGGSVDATYRLQILDSGQPGTIRYLRGDRSTPQVEAWLRTLTFERSADARAGAEIDVHVLSR